MFTNAVVPFGLAIDYKDIKSDYSLKLMQLQARFAGLNTDNDNIETLLNSGIETLYRLHSVYQYTEFIACRDLIGSIYPENLIYDGSGFRTKRVNEAVQLIYLINKQLDSNKKETNQNISVLSLMVVLTNLFTNHFLYDLKKLGKF